MEDPIIGKLPRNIKDWFARAVVGMIWADGYIDKAEIEYLKGIIGCINDPMIVHSTLEMVKENQIPPLEPVRLDEVQAYNIMRHLATISIVDKDLATAEENFLKYVGVQLGLQKEVAEKFLKGARKRLSGSRFVAQLILGDEAHDVTCFGFTENECMFFCERSINPLARLTLQLYREQDRKKAGKERYQPIVAETMWCRAVKSQLGDYVIKATFKHTIGEGEGIRLVFHNKQTDHKHKGRLKPSNSSLLGFYVNCYACGKKDIPFWQLRLKSMHSKNNLFGIPVYDKAMGENDFCDFNLIQVAVCPRCFFASNQLDSFQRQDKAQTAALFDTQAFNMKWQPSTQKRKKIVGDNNKWLSSEKRTAIQAIRSYQLAVETHDKISRVCIDREVINHKRKSVSFLLTQAELLMNQGEANRAKLNLKEAERRLESIFSNLEKDAGIRAAFILVMIKIYFNNYEDIGSYLNFLNNYSKIHTVTTGSSELKALNHAMVMTKEAWQRRDEINHKKMKRFHLKE